MSAVATCREVITFLAEYLADELPGERRASFERHLALCDACVDYIVMYESTIRLARVATADLDLRLEDMPQDLVDAILEATLGRG
jgi:anti-sigma factor RsiW